MIGDEKLAELRERAKEGEDCARTSHLMPGAVVVSSKTLLALLDEIERLRGELERRCGKTPGWGHD